ncbi:hypothetical protein CQW44_11615 [Streptomyces griseofuscus]|uniref:Uncharacterized protein n=1 Tax=Streptomyces griseofuscus TaxID=146922 RepID=A0A426S8R2_9ACTN|nr:hypothetical protein CQW44_11615 [Streptomyces griseofuscus]
MPWGPERRFRRAPTARPAGRLTVVLDSGAIDREIEALMRLVHAIEAECRAYAWEKSFHRHLIDDSLNSLDATAREHMYLAALAGLARSQSADRAQHRPGRERLTGLAHSPARIRRGKCALIQGNGLSS